MHMRAKDVKRGMIVVFGCEHVPCVISGNKINTKVEFIALTGSYNFEISQDMMVDVEYIIDFENRSILNMTMAFRSIPHGQKFLFDGIEYVKLDEIGKAIKNGFEVVSFGPDTQVILCG